MKKIFVLCVTVAFLSGCASVKQFFGFQAPQEIPDKIIVTKSEAVSSAKDYLRANGFDDEFRTYRPVKIKKLLTMENEPRWVWQIYFPHKDRKFWKFWKRSPIMVEIDAQDGQILRWGRR